MSKRGPNKVPPKKRRWRKNGISTSVTVMDVPTDKPQLMRVWHTNTEEPGVSRQSVVPISSEPQVQEEDMQVVGENFGVIASVVKAKPKRRRGNDSVSGSYILFMDSILINSFGQTKMETWLSIRPIILDELLRRDGLQEHLSPPQCTSCLDEQGAYHCVDCTTSTFYCASCVVCQHENIPLHRLEVCLSSLERRILILYQVWNGGFFERTSLQDLDYCFYLGHQHTPCPSSGPRTQTILVIDVNGVHRLSVQFCMCTDDAQWVEKYRQLLRVGWYPASFKQPKTAFTFDVLDTYHKIALQGKLNLYDFYSSILQKTDNCGRKKTVVSYASPPL